MYNMKTNLLPKEIVFLYYKSLTCGDLKILKRVMVPSTYMMTLEAYGLGIVFKEPYFKHLLDICKEDESALQKVEEAISKKLNQDNKEYKIEYFETEVTSNDRRTVHYKEDEKLKKLYFSSVKNSWKIDYMAGRKR